MDEFRKKFVKNGRVIRGTWQNKDNHKFFAECLGKELGYKEREDWYGITAKKFIDNNGGSLLSIYYSVSPSKFVKAMFQEDVFYEWKFGQIQMGFWKEYKNQKQYADWLGKELGYKCPEDWYQINGKLILDYYGCGLVSNYYSGSPIKFVKAMFHDNKFLEWKFACVPMGFWDQYDNRKQYADWLGIILGYKTPEHWYKISAKSIINNYGRGLLCSAHYSNSPIKFVRDMFPTHVFFEWKFYQVSLGFWKEYSNHKLYANWLGEELGYKCPDDWYQLTQKLIMDNYGAGLIVLYYFNSPSKFVKAMFPHIVFFEWKFLGKSSKCFWEEYTNQKQYTDWLGKELGYTCFTDWYQISARLIQDKNGGGLLNYYYSGSPSQFVKAMFPEHPWVLSKFRKSYSSGQIQWLEYLMVSTPDIRHALHKEGEMKIPNSRYKADGYSEVGNCIYEYHGDFWHGNPAIYPSLEINPLSKMTYGELYEKTLKKQKHCEEECGYRYYFVWESNWMKGKKAVIDLQRLFRGKKYKN